MSIEYRQAPDYSRTPPRVYDIMAPIAVDEGTILGTSGLTVQGASMGIAWFTSSDLGVSGATSDTNFLDEILAYRLIHPGSGSAGFRRLVQVRSPNPFLHKATAPTAHRDIRGAFRIRYRMAWLTPRTLATQTINGLEMYLGAVVGSNSPQTNGIGIALQQKSSGLYFISRRANGGVLLIDELVAPAIVDRTWYDLELRIISATRTTPARLDVLVDGVVEYSNDWDSGLLPVPSDSGVSALWRVAVAKGPPQAAGADDVASRIYVASARLTVGATLAEIL